MPRQRYNLPRIYLHQVPHHWGNKSRQIRSACHWYRMSICRHVYAASGSPLTSKATGSFVQCSTSLMSCQSYCGLILLDTRGNLLPPYSCNLGNCSHASTKGTWHTSPLTMNPQDGLHSTEEPLVCWASRARALLAVPTQEVPASWPWSEAVPAGPARPLQQRRAAPSPAPESGPSARVALGEAGRPSAAADEARGFPAATSP